MDPREALEKLVAACEVKVPALPEPPEDAQSDADYTDWLTGARKFSQARPYPGRNRQCSIGYHGECSDPAGDKCECPCHAVARVLPDARAALAAGSPSAGEDWQSVCARAYRHLDKHKSGDENHRVAAYFTAMCILARSVLSDAKIAEIERECREADAHLIRDLIAETKATAGTRVKQGAQSGGTGYECGKCRRRRVIPRDLVDRTPCACGAHPGYWCGSFDDTDATGSPSAGEIAREMIEEYTGIPYKTWMSGGRGYQSGSWDALADRIAAALTTARAAGFQAGAEKQRERDAQLHDSVPTGCDCDPAGAGAMGAVIAYRDTIRATPTVTEGE